MWEYKEKKIDSSESSLSLVERFVEEICDENYIPETHFGNIILALGEAVRNAMIHGNRLDSAKQVIVTYERKRGEISFTVEDEGNGFDPSAILSPLDSDSAGKGLFLIRSLSDKLEFSHPGNKITLTFTISSMNQETTLSRISHLKNYFRKQKTYA